MLCDQCADLVAGECRSASDAARKLHGAAVRDQWEIEECDDHRLREDRPACDDEDLGDRAGRTLRARLMEVAEDATEEEAFWIRANAMFDAWKRGPRHLTVDALEEWVPLAVDLRERLIRLITTCPELEKARGRRYRLTWRTTRWTSGGDAVLGSSKPIPVPQREKFQIAESWEIILSLPVWLLFDETARDRLLHHELMHAATACRHHAVQEWPETVARYGLADRDQARLTCAGILHPSARERIERWCVAADGQLLLVPVAGLECVEVRVPE